METLQFICPQCESVLKIPPRYLGMLGRCNKCGARIALIGDPNTGGPQRASIAADAPSGKSAAAATEKQREYLRALGVNESALEGLSRDEASELIERAKAARRAGEAPTEKQMAYLHRLGAPESLIARVTNKEEASRLIEAMHLHPSPMQLAELRELGATGAQIATCKTQGAAQALIGTLRMR